MRHFRTRIGASLVGFIWLWSLLLPTGETYAQNNLPTPDQLDQLLAPVALYPDTLLAQICAASTDPQQVLDVNNWLHQNMGLSGQARTDAAEAQGFDPAFIALVNFPQVLEMMAQNIDNFAAIGQAFAADQGMVMDSVQRLRQQAYAVGALESNQYQTVDVQNQGTSQVVVIQPASPQIVFVPQYDPYAVFAQPSPTAVMAAPFLTFGAGIALGAWMNNSRPWGWGGWGWNWGRRSMMFHNNPWAFNNRYRPRNPSFHHRPPVFNRPIHVRPPNNWHNRPFYRPPSSGARPPGSRPPSVGRPPVSGPGTRPPANQPVRPGSPQRPSQRPPSSGSRPTQQRPAPGPGQRPGQRPGQQSRPNPNAGFSRGPGASSSGGRTSAFGGGNNPAADRAAINRGRSSVASQQRRGGGNPR